jgi:O-antigen/teichoic acid export membrane protein
LTPLTVRNVKTLYSITFASGVLTLARMVSGVVIAKIIAIYAGPSGLVMIGQVQSLVAVMNGLVTAPGGNGLVRYTAEHHPKGLEACSPWWSASLKWGLSLLLPFFLLFGIFSDNIAQWLFDSSKYSWIVFLILCGLPSSMGSAFVLSTLNGLGYYRRLIGLGFFSVALSTTIMLLLLSANGIEGAILATSVSAGITGAIVIFANWREPWCTLKYWWVDSDYSHLKGVGGYVLMAITTAITMPLTLMAIRKILIEALGWEQAGYWQAVYKISEAYLSVITISLSIYFLPRLSSLSGYQLIKREIEDVAKLIMPVVVAMALSVYFFRDFVIELLFTRAFDPAKELFAVQLTGDVVKILSWFYAYPMISTGSVKWFTATEIFFSISLVLLTYYFVDSLGLKGAVLAYLFNYCIYFVFVYKNLHKFAR